MSQTAVSFQWCSSNSYIVSLTFPSKTTCGYLILHPGKSEWVYEPSKSINDFTAKELQEIGEKLVSLNEQELSFTKTLTGMYEVCRKGQLVGGLYKGHASGCWLFLYEKNATILSPSEIKCLNSKLAELHQQERVS